MFHELRRPERSAASQGEVATACLILAGGRSRRMGHDKALLRLPNTGETFLGRLVALGRRHCSELLVVARDATEAARYAAAEDVPAVSDLQPDQGPLMGIYSGLRLIQAPRALVMAVDMPLVQPSLLTFLCALPESDRLVVPLVRNIPQMLLALYPRRLLPLMARQLAAGRHDPRSLLEVAPVRYLGEAELRPFDPALRSFFNVNTPEDLQALSERG
jgi:molybdopterin-guanine dinucleotide biosynthesis protein A